jgi:hypothetical protein
MNSNYLSGNCRVPYNSGIYNDLVFIAAETTDEKETTEIELSYNVEANATDLGESSTSNTSPNKTEDVETEDSRYVVYQSRSCHT